MTVLSIAPPPPKGNGVASGLREFADLYEATGEQLPLGRPDPFTCLFTAPSDEDAITEINRIAALLGTDPFPGPRGYTAVREFSGKLVYTAAAVLRRDPPAGTSLIAVAA